MRTRDLVEHEAERVGSEGAGTLELRSGAVGHMLDQSGFEIGSEVGGEGTLTITDPGTRLVPDPEALTGLSVGNQGKGTLILKDGAEASFGTMNLGLLGFGDGTIIVRDDATLEQTYLDPRGRLNVDIGDNGRGFVSVLDGGRFKIVSPVFLGSQEHAHGTIGVEGGASELEAFLITVGGDGLGELHVAQGAVVTLTNDDRFEGFPHGLGLGTGFGGFGWVTVAGDARIEVKGEIIIGNEGDGVMEIASGGQVRGDRGFQLGLSTDVFSKESELEVTGDGSLFRVVTPSLIGRPGDDAEDAVLTVSDGARLETHDVGIHSTSADITISGDFSSWTARDVDLAQGTLTVDALVQVRSLRIGTLGNVIVTPGADLRIGGAPPGPQTPGLSARALFVAAGGIVIADAATVDGGTLGGDGTFAFDVVSDGVVSPGNEPCEIAVFEIDGDYVQVPDGTLLIEMNGPQADDADALVVTGNVTLGGTLRLVEFDGYLPQAGDSFTILTTANGIVTGAFDAIDACADVSVTYDPDRVVVQFTSDCAPPTCPADIDLSGSVDFQDIILVLDAWGPCDYCDADLDGDCDVGFQDIVLVLDAWGSCDSCDADLDGSGGVDFNDLVRVLSAWGKKRGAEDLDGSGTVDFGDIIVVLDAWGTCD